MTYYSVKVYIKNRPKPLTGIRQYPTDNYEEVYEIIIKEVLKKVSMADLLKIDVWPLTEKSLEVQTYLRNRH